MSDSEIEQLIYECLEQSRSAQKILYKSFYGFAMGICLRYSNNRYEASEIINKGFLKAFTSLHRYNHQHPFKAWLRKIMVNTSIDYYRSNLKTAAWVEVENIELISKEIYAESKLNYDDLLALVQQLPPAYRAVFNLYAIDGYSHKEISKY